MTLTVIKNKVFMNARVAISQQRCPVHTEWSKSLKLPTLVIYREQILNGPYVC